MNRANRFYAARQKKEWDKSVKSAVEPLGVKFECPVWLAFNWQTKTRANDPDNLAASAKYIMDGLVEAGVIQNDNLTVIQSPIVHHYTRGANKVVLLISNVPIFEIKPQLDVKGLNLVD